jgi:ubiquitin-conjugating enzyme E2 Z
MSNPTDYVTKETMNRLVKEVSDIFKNPLTEQGIYYVHDDTNMLRGYAMIIGPKNTVYEDGYYFFDIKYPPHYPLQPPKVTYMTNDGITRFHPNLYKSGKVCLSILNTWRGEGWTSCQTIKSVLLTLVSILDENPFLNEPGIKENHSDIDSYNKILKYKSYQVSILGMLNKKYIVEHLYDIFNDIMKELYLQKKDKIMNELNELVTNQPTEILNMHFYRIKVNIDYKNLLEDFIKFNSSL